ncbi:hypothetical protein IGI04_002841, partial [Brassica rapa subsp. trilocularis]
MTSMKSRRLQESLPDDFQEVQTTSKKSSRRLPVSHHGSLLTKSPFHNRSERFCKFLCLIFLHLVFNQMVLIFHSFKGFSDLEDFWDDLLVSRLKYNALDDFQEVFQTTSTSVSSGLPGSLLTKSTSISSGVQACLCRGMIYNS